MSDVVDFVFNHNRDIVRDPKCNSLGEWGSLCKVPQILQRQSNSHGLLQVNCSAVVVLLVDGVTVWLNDNTSTSDISLSTE